MIRLSSGGNSQNFFSFQAKNVTSFLLAFFCFCRGLYMILYIIAHWIHPLCNLVIIVTCFPHNRVIVQLSYFSELLSSPMCPGSCLPLNRMQTVTLKQLVFWLPSWQCGAVMLMDAGREMATSTVITGRVLQPIQNDTGGRHWALKRVQRKNENEKMELCSHSPQ